MIVDDGFLTVRSADLSNRSMCIGSELHLTWEHEGGTADPFGSIRNGPNRTAIFNPGH